MGKLAKFGSQTMRLSKADMVRDAVAEGITDNKQGVDYIWREYGLVMSTDVFSTYKGYIKKHGSNNGATLKKSPAPPPPAERAKPDLGALTTLKGLIREHGPELVKGMVELLS